MSLKVKNLLASIKQTNLEATDSQTIMENKINEYKFHSHLQESSDIVGFVSDLHWSMFLVEYLTIPYHAISTGPKMGNSNGIVS